MLKLSYQFLAPFPLSLDPVDGDGHTPLSDALRQEHTAAARVLLRCGANLDIVEAPEPDWARVFVVCVALPFICAHLTALNQRTILASFIFFFFSLFLSEQV
jgi:hypothetical protein